MKDKIVKLYDYELAKVLPFYPEIKNEWLVKEEDGKFIVVENTEDKNVELYTTTGMVDLENTEDLKENIHEDDTEWTFTIFPNTEECEEFISDYLDSYKFQYETPIEKEDGCYLKHEDFK